MFTSGVTSEGSAVLGLRKFGACSAVSVGRLTLVEGGLVWRLVAKTWDFVVTFFRRFCRLIRIYTPIDTGKTVCIAANTILIGRESEETKYTANRLKMKKMAKTKNM